MERIVRIAVCDDNVQVHDDLKVLLQKFSDTHVEETFLFMAFETGEELLACKEPIDLLFLDIELGEKSGIDLVPVMQQKYPNIIIMFISSHTKYFIYSHRLNVFQYLTKPFDERIFFEEMERFFDKYHRMYDVYTIELRNAVVQFPIYEIVYIEAALRHLKIHHCQMGMYEKVGQISKEEMLLKQYGFIRCHHGYLVNPRYIERIKGQTIYLKHVLNGSPGMLKELSVSKNKLQQVIQQYQLWLQTQKD